MTAVIDVANIKAHLNLTTDTDDDLLAEKIDAAQECVEAFIGAMLDDEEAFPDGVPEPLKEAVRQYAAHLYENREGQELPLGVFDAVGPYRRWCF